MIGIIGYGMVGKAVSYGFSKTDQLISDPKYNDLTVEYMCGKDPEAIFVCVPTPTDDTNYEVLIGVLDRIFATSYSGIVVVKSTVLPNYIEQYPIVYNPEFLSRATANEDFVKPPFVLIGSNDQSKADRLASIYRSSSVVDTDKFFFTDIKTASLAKYCMNSFYATKVTFMNQMYDVAQHLGVNWEGVASILANHPWMGTHHFQVPGPDGGRGFGGPCLPKDTEALVKEFDVELLKSVLAVNQKYRS
jgi:nucleotide sugar dehydrogenase